MYKKGMGIDNIKISHVQGIATDKNREYMYYSCTTFLAKTDMEGNIIGTVKGLAGHLGCIAYNYDDGKLYGSLEYKCDAVGAGILNRIKQTENREVEISDAFYVAIFDVEKITRPDMDAESDGVMKVVHLNEVLADYIAPGHRYGCSGIDGMTFAPMPGGVGGKKYLYVAYGIYADNNRCDNDHQIILRYDTENWDKYTEPLVQSDMPRKGPELPDSKYFVYTGNTTYGIQNLEYDEKTGYMFAAVYGGKKEKFPNFPMYVIDLNRKSEWSHLEGKESEGEKLQLAEVGEYDEKSGIWGIRFPYGSTGMISLGDGHFYFSKDFTNPDGTRGAVVALYEFDGKKEFLER